MATLSPAVTQNREQRRKALMASSLKGLDFVTVEHGSEPDPRTGAQLWRLRLHFVPSSAARRKRPAPENLSPANIGILLDGVPDPRVSVSRVLGGSERIIEIEVRTLGREAYLEAPPVHMLELVEVSGLDPLFSAAPVSFRIGMPVVRRGHGSRPEAEPVEPIDFDYQVKDFESFRQLMLERMAFYIPSWGERNPSDLGVTIIEVLAYAADYLSYYQDAVAGEAYLDTARRRISVRRHTRLLDFQLIEGTNSRVWVHVQVEAIEGAQGGPRALRLPAATRLFTALPRIPGCIEEGSEDYRWALEQNPLVFQTLHPATLSVGYNWFSIYAWGADEYVLPKGATSGALVGRLDRLQAGDVLVFEKLLGPDLKNAPMPDPRERQAVRLSRPPAFARDPLTGTEITEITWHDDDALGVDFPVRGLVGRVQQEQLSIVRGNVVLADQGETLVEILPDVPAGARYSPTLLRPGLTFREPFDAVVARTQPAARAVEQVPWLALPEIELFEAPEAALTGPLTGIDPAWPRWRPRYDLLGSRRFSRDFVVEIDDKGRANLRFGEGQCGLQPPAGARFVARYRVGVGPRGNVGAQALRHVVVPGGGLRDLAKRGLKIAGVRNHLPGVGGSHPRPTQHAQVYAPDILHTFAFQRRAVTESDQAALAMRHPEVLGAVAQKVWSGGSHVILLSVQRPGGRRLDAGFEERLRRFLKPFHLLGIDLVIRGPQYVPLDIQMTVLLKPGVREEPWRHRFSLAAGQPGTDLFDPDAFTFGEPVYLSRLTALLMAIPGTADVRPDTFKRWGQPPAGELESGRISIGAVEIARLDNDPLAPQNGTFTVQVREQP